MKRLIALLAAAAFVLSLATMVSAAHEGRSNLETSGFLQTSIGTSQDISKTDGDFTAGSRLRQYFDYVASENLKAIVGYEFDSDWGSTEANTNNNPGVIQGDIGADGDAGGDNTGDAGSIAIKRAMLQFTFPGTEAQVRSGIHYISLPGGAIGTNPVLAADAAGITMSNPVSDNVDLTVGWTRAMDTNSTTFMGDEPGTDAFFASMPINADGFSLSPYFMYAVIGDDVDGTQWGEAFFKGLSNMQNGAPPFSDDASVYWAGSSFNLTMMDPMAIDGSFVYGSLDADKDANERSGWYADLSMKFKMEKMTPEIYGWYATGEDDDFSDGSETLPIIYNDATTAKGPGFLIGDYTVLGVTSKGPVQMQAEPYGLWAIGGALNHISLTDRLTSTILAAYYQGTSDKDAGITGSTPYYSNEIGLALDEEDSAWEVALSSKYEMYEQLSAILEAGYGEADFDEDVESNKEEAYNLAVGFKYDF